MLQNHIDNLLLEESKCDMEFNPSECQVVRMTTSRNPINYLYHQHGQVLEDVTSAMYMGVDISSVILALGQVLQRCWKNWLVIPPNSVCSIVSYTDLWQFLFLNISSPTPVCPALLPLIGVSPSPRLSRLLHFFLLPLTIVQWNALPEWWCACQLLVRSRK